VGQLSYSRRCGTFRQTLRCLDRGSRVEFRISILEFLPRFGNISTAAGVELCIEQLV
jgi:hypothetical protein